MNDGEYFKTFYLFCIVIIEIFVFSYSKEEYSKSHKVSLQNLNYIIEDTYKRF